jgi:hypothetical protein
VERQHCCDTTGIGRVDRRQALLVKADFARGIPFHGEGLLAHGLDGELLELVLLDDGYIGSLSCRRQAHGLCDSLYAQAL